MATTTGAGIDLSLHALLDLLGRYLAAPAGTVSPPGLPAPAMAVTSLDERQVGLGRRTGTVRHDGFTAVELKGVRLDALVRFTVWGTATEPAEQAASDLGVRLLAARDALRAGGVLRLALQQRDAALETPGVGWSVVQTYRVLFESEYADADDAVGLIARIPIRFEGEQEGGADTETTEVTDALVRWDRTGAPPLVALAPGTVAGLSALHYWSAAAPAGAVRLVRTTQPPPATPPDRFVDLGTFLDHVAGTAVPTRNAVLELPSLDALLAQMVADPVPVVLGDLEPDGVGDAYRAHAAVFDPPILLTRPDDVLRIESARPSGLDATGVIYLRWLPPSAPAGP